MHKKMLLIDDDDDEQYFFTEALREINFPVKFFFARGAEDGIKMVEFVDPDFIFIDFNMPAINGLQCLEKIKRKGIRDGSIIILYSTGLTNNLCKEALNKGANICIKKKSSVNELVNTLKNFLS